MQNWNIERFLQHALPQELESLRLIGLNRIMCQDVQVWRSHLVPIDAREGESPWEFTIDMLWELEKDPPTLQFWTVASIAMPASSRAWLMQEVARRNDREAVPLSLIEHEDGRLSLSAALVGEISSSDTEAFMARKPAKPVIEGFAQSYETASETLLLAWQDGVNIGKAYRAMN